MVDKILENEVIVHSFTIFSVVLKLYKYNDEGEKDNLEGTKGACRYDISEGKGAAAWKQLRIASTAIGRKNKSLASSQR